MLLTLRLRTYMFYNIYFIDKKFFYSKKCITFVVSIIAVSRNIQSISLLKGRSCNLQTLKGFFY